MNAHIPEPGRPDVRWRFAVDRGGTFTDVIGVAPNGALHTAKVLSESPGYEDAGVEGIRRILDLPPGSVLPEGRIASIHLGTTVATNALLERRGAATGLLITAGFRDLLEIGTQDRPELFALAVRKPGLLYGAVEEVNERLDARGEVVRPLSVEGVRTGLERMRACGIESVAIVFLFSWKNADHERRASEAARAAGFAQVSTSHETMRVIGAVPRGRTTLVDAYLGPVLARYVRRLRRWTGDVPVYFMSSSGSLMEPGAFAGKDAILSGPAGGVIGVTGVADVAGGGGERQAVVGFDMGGTSTDVCRYSGELDRAMDVETAGVRFTSPTLKVETVASGGGSVLGFDGRKLTVGPRSAGADPGPACYGRGGPAAVTDANLVLGRIQPGCFPRLFGPGYDAQLDPAAARSALGKLADQVERSQGRRMSVEELALGFVRIANETMSRPIKELTVARGHDPRTHALVCFGGAGGQHACGIARSLGIRTVYVPPFAGLLSAFGILHVPHRRMQVESVLRPLSDESLAAVRARAEEIADELSAALCEQAGLPAGHRFERVVQVDVRPPGANLPLTVPLGDADKIRGAFERAHRQRYGFVPGDTALEVAGLRVELSEQRPAWRFPEAAVAQAADRPEPAGEVAVWFSGEGPTRTPLFRREHLRPGVRLGGPALIVEDHSTVLVEPGFDLVVDPRGILRLELLCETRPQAGTACDPVLLEVFHHLLMGVAEQMGEVLRQTAHSVNIRERLDFSCAVFDAAGRLVANAAHIPVHLGAMGETVKDLIRSAGGAVRPGDCFASNDPFAGGSHLPDITVMSPVFRGGRPAFYVAARGHHTDVGGVAPGSMPPSATRLEEEGVVLRNVRIAAEGGFCESAARAAFTSGPHPVRNLPERLADLHAQIAACRKGEGELDGLCERYGDEVVTAYMGHIRDDARAAMQEALIELLGGAEELTRRFEDRLDGGARIALTLSIRRNDGAPSAVVDFAGTDAEQAGNLNAPPAVTRAAVLYVVRTLIRRPVPLNDGCLDPIEIRIPRGSLLDPLPGAAVSGGNVETSQRVVDVLYGALGVAAASQGTMNNVLMGDPSGGGAQYYETIAGGSGAVEGAEGADAVQVHMTNTRITDLEVLETRFPAVRVERFLVRRGSGGVGLWRGGDGVIRVFEFLARQAVSILSERRARVPFGAAGGLPGRAGENRIVRRDGRVERVGGHYHGVLEQGDRLEIHTPGGGGFGRASG